ncbi:MAG: preprotein translocase subunit SecG [Candidatus Thiodiazotropha sp.]
MQTILVVSHLFLAIGLIGLILIQHGKGADMGAAFGSGASGTVFGSKGSASFLTRLTAGLATLFFVTSMVMAYFASQGGDNGDAVLDALQQAGTSAEAQSQSDLPPIPAGSDLPPAATNGDLPAVPETDLPVAAETDAQTAPAETSDTAPAEAASAETTDAIPAEAAPVETTDTAPAEVTPPVESKE